jgi:hypothetical protein
MFVLNILQWFFMLFSALIGFLKFPFKKTKPVKKKNYFIKMNKPFICHNCLSAGSIQRSKPDDTPLPIIVKRSHDTLADFEKQHPRGPLILNPLSIMQLPFKLNKPTQVKDEEESQTLQGCEFVDEEVVKAVDDEKVASCEGPSILEKINRKEVVLAVLGFTSWSGTYLV